MLKKRMGTFFPSEATPDGKKTLVEAVDKTTLAAYSGMKILFGLYEDIAENLAFLYGINLPAKRRSSDDPEVKIPEDESWMNFKNYPGTFVVPKILNIYFLLSAGNEVQKIENLKKLFLYFSSDKSVSFAENETIESLLNKKIPIHSSFSQIDITLKDLFAMSDCQLIEKLNCYGMPTEPNRRYPLESQIEQLLKEAMGKTTEYQILDSAKLQKIILQEYLQEPLTFLKSYQDFRLKIMIFSSILIKELVFSKSLMHCLNGMMCTLDEQKNAREKEFIDSPAVVSTHELRKKNLLVSCEIVEQVLAYFPSYNAYIGNLLNDSVIKRISTTLNVAPDQGKTKFSSLLKNIEGLLPVTISPLDVIDCHLGGLNDILPNIDSVFLENGFLSSVQKHMKEVGGTVCNTLLEIRNALEKILQSCAVGFENAATSNAEAKTPRKRASSLPAIPSTLSVEKPAEDPAEDGDTGGSKFYRC
jgi:hypothetical protein